MPNLPDDLYQQALAQQNSGTNPWLATTAPGVPQIVKPGSMPVASSNGLPDPSATLGGSPQNFHESPNTTSVYNPPASQTGIVAPKGFTPTDLSGIGNKESATESKKSEEIKKEDEKKYPVKYSGGLASGNKEASPSRQRMQEAGEEALASHTIDQGRLDTIEDQKNWMKKGADASDKYHQEADMKSKADSVQSAFDTERVRQHDAQDNAAIAKEAAEARAQSVDPDHWFKKVGVAGSIASAFAIAAGAFGASMPHTGGGGKNYALDIINTSIDQDIAAQKDNIDQKWKAVEMHIKESDRERAHAIFINSENNKIRLKDLDHTNALADQAISSTNNQSKIVGMNNLKSDVNQHMLETADKQSQLKYSVLQDEANKKAAAAAADPFSAANLNKAYKNYFDKTVEEISKDPSKGGSVLPREQWLKSYMSQGYTPSGGGTKEAKEEQAFENGVDKVVQSGKEASKQGIGDVVKDTAGHVVSSLLNPFAGAIPQVQNAVSSRIAPEATANIDKTNQYNHGVLTAVTRLMGDRVPPESIQKQVESFKIDPGMSDKQKQDRISAYTNFLHTGRDINIGAKKGDTNGVVPGAEEIK